MGINMTFNLANKQTAAILLVFTSCVIIFLMAHHPTIIATDLSGQLTENHREIQINGFVHGGLVVAIILNLLAFTIYSASRSTSSLAVKTGLITYSFSALLMAIAALMNGFIFPAFLDDISTYQPELLQFTPVIRVYSWNINQALANTSVIGSSAAIVFWSINLFSTRLLQKVVAIMGVLIGLAICVSIVSGGLHLDIKGMAFVVFAHSLWNLALAYLLFFNKTNQA
jgi:hypothetical protein